MDAEKISGKKKEKNDVSFYFIFGVTEKVFDSFFVGRSGLCETVISERSLLYCQVDVTLSDGTFARAAVPSGASTGRRSIFV